MKFSSTQLGFSTLELLIAFAVLTLSLSAVILVAFGNQAYAIDTNLAQRALYLTESNLESTIAKALNGFENVSGASNITGNYHETISITDISECAKRIDSTTGWTQGLRQLDTRLSTIVISTFVADALAADCAIEEPSDDWENPGVFVDENVTGQADATALDEFNHFVYLTTNPSSAGKDDFFIYEFNEGSVSLSETGSLNTSPGYSAGLMDIDVAGKYAYVASASSSDQFQVIDVNPLSANYLSVLWEVSLPDVDPSGSYPAGRSIYQYDDRVYIGTAETNGPEFHIFNVANIDVTPPTHLGSLELTHNVNDIVVSGDYAYLATSDDNHELMVIDISDPTNLIHPDISGLGFDAPGKNDGSSLYVGSDQVYLGRYQSNPQTDSFFIIDRPAVLDNSNVSDGTLGTHDIGLQNNTYVAAVRVSTNLAFLALDDPNQGLIIYDISDPNNIFLPATCSEFNYSENTVDLDNDLSTTYLFAANGSNKEISIIHDQDSLCSP